MEEIEQEVLDFLAERGIDAPRVVADLRQNPKAAVFEGTEILQVCETPVGKGTSIRLCDILFSMYHTKEGNLAVADIQGYKLAMAAGQPQSPQPVACDVLLAGSRAGVGNLRPARAVILGLDAVEGIVTFGGSQPVVQIRPGRSVRFLEVNRC